jgi:hypothetical protein
MNTKAFKLLMVLKAVGNSPKKMGFSGGFVAFSLIFIKNHA